MAGVNQSWPCALPFPRRAADSVSAVAFINSTPVCPPVIRSAFNATTVHFGDNVIKGDIALSGVFKPVKRMLANMYDIAEYMVLPVILISGDQNESALNTAKGNGNHKNHGRHLP